MKDLSTTWIDPCLEWRQWSKNYTGSLRCHKIHNRIHDEGWNRNNKIHQESSESKNLLESLKLVKNVFMTQSKLEKQNATIDSSHQCICHILTCSTKQSHWGNQERYWWHSGLLHLTRECWTASNWNRRAWRIHSTRSWWLHWCSHKRIK